jgi:hypothetical protein
MFKQVFISNNSYVKFQMTTFVRKVYIRTSYVSFTRNAQLQRPFLTFPTELLTSNKIP